MEPWPEQYAAAFRDNAIEVLPRLTAEDLKELGVAAPGIAACRSAC